MGRPIQLNQFAIYRNNSGAERRILILDNNTRWNSKIVWQNVETGDCYQCNRQSFVYWIRRPVIRKSTPRQEHRFRIDGQKIVDQLSAIARETMAQARRVEAAALRRKLDESDNLTDQQVKSIWERLNALNGERVTPYR